MSASRSNAIVTLGAQDPVQSAFREDPNLTSMDLFRCPISEYRKALSLFEIMSCYHFK